VDIAKDIKMTIENHKRQWMHDVRVKHLIFALLLCGVLSPIASGQGKVSESRKPYIDKLNGFSILPPETATWNPRKSPGTIVEWFCYNPK